MNLAFGQRYRDLFSSLQRKENGNDRIEAIQSSANWRDRAGDIPLSRARLATASFDMVKISWASRQPAGPVDLLQYRTRSYFDCVEHLQSRSPQIPAHVWSLRTPAFSGLSFRGVRPRATAAKFGLYWSSEIAAITLSFVLEDTSEGLFRTRETVATDTLARIATCLTVVVIPILSLG
jgi:hypothetical protein